MNYSKQEVMQYVQEEDVKFIRLAFCDVFGKQKNISIMPEELPRAFEYGIAIDASAIEGFGDETHSDLLLHPDADTLMPLPWSRNGRKSDDPLRIQNAAKHSQTVVLRFFVGGYGAGTSDRYCFCLR